MKGLVVDISGTHVKAVVSGQRAAWEFKSGPDLLPKSMVAEANRLVGRWRYAVVSIGYRGPVLRDRPASTMTSCTCRITDIYQCVCARWWG
jgi:hypothetical protein